MTLDEQFMAAACKEARKGFDEGEVPIGAVAVKNGEIIASGHNQRNFLVDLTAHAEMMCLRDFSKKSKDMFLSGVTVYSTLEPCAMCLGAMIHYRIERIVFGEYDILAGACGTKYNFHEIAGINVDGGVYREPCRNILLEYFEKQLGRKSHIWKDIELPEK